MCIIHVNSVILILDFVRIQLVVTWLICRRRACHIILCSYEPNEVAFGLVCGKDESSREDTSSTDTIGADFDSSR